MMTAYVQDCNRYDAWANRNPAKAWQRAYGQTAVGVLTIWNIDGVCTASKPNAGGGKCPTMSLENTGRDEIVRAAREFFGTGKRLKLRQNEGHMQVYVVHEA